MLDKKIKKIIDKYVTCDTKRHNLLVYLLEFGYLEIKYEYSKN